jgi:Ca-activated chloride channel homolog
MAKRYFLFLWFLLAFFAGPGTWTAAQEGKPNIRVVVDMVQLNVAVTDSKGNYVTGLRPQDFVVTEDGIKEKIATFGEGNEPTRRLLDIAEAPAVNQLRDPAQGSVAQDPPTTFSSLVAGANVFILFDTSNYMYRGFVFAQDAIADFIRSLERADNVAFYSYSRDLSRAAPLTSDRSQVLRGVRSTVAGDDAALYNCLLLTVKDAAKYTGRKMIVVFSNGPDNASMVPPEDVAELAQYSGIPIYMVSTEQAKLEPVSTAVFERMTAATGGKAYFAKTWRDQKRAFASIRDDLGHLYSLSYYPQANPNRGWRSVTVKLVGEHLKKYHIRTRNGYRPQPVRFSAGSAQGSLRNLFRSNHPGTASQRNKVKGGVARIHLDEMVDPNYVVVASIEKKYLPPKKKP